MNTAKLTIKGSIPAARKAAARARRRQVNAAAEPSNNMRTVRATRGERLTKGRSRAVVGTTYSRSADWRPALYVDSNARPAPYKANQLRNGR